MNDNDQIESALLLELEKKFQQALSANQQNDVDRANKLFQEIINIEPRLPEARLEYAFNLIGMGRLNQAQGHAEEAARLLEISGPWLADLELDVLLSMAYALQGEILREQASTDDVVFRQPEQFQLLMDQAKSCFQKAAALDPSNEHAQYWGGFDGAWESPMASLDDEVLNHPIPEDNLVLEEDSSEDESSSSADDESN